MFKYLLLVVSYCIASQTCAEELCHEAPEQATPPSISLPKEQAVIETDYQSWDLQGNSYFEGNVSFSQGDQSISAEKLQLTDDEKNIIATGTVKLLTPLVAIQADSMQGNMAEKNLSFNNTLYQFQTLPMRGDAQKIEFNQNDRIMKLQDSSLTTCPKNQETWTLEASQIELDAAQGWGEAKHIRLNIKEVPVFYFPYLRFPLNDERQSGFLFPKIRYSSSNGLDLETPYYLNLAPHYDATLTPRFMSERGTQLQTEFRYLSAYGQSNLHLDYLPSDKNYLNGNEDRQLFSLEQEHHYTPHWYSNFNYIEVSDNDYFNDLGAYTGFDSHERLTREANAGYQDQYWRFNAQVKNYQLLTDDEKPYEKRPDLEYSFDYPEPITGIRWQFLAKFNQFEHQDKVTGERLLFKPRVSYPFSWSSGYIIPSVSYDVAMYRQDLTHQDPQQSSPLTETPRRAIPTLSLHSGIWLERTLTLGSSPYTQTLEPQVHYLYTPYEYQDDMALFDTTETSGGFDSLFRENRYLGYDRVGEANQATLALSTKIVRQDTGEERLSLRIGRSFYNNSTQDHGQHVRLSPNETAPNSSPYIADFGFKLTQDWHFDTNIEWDANNAKTLEGGAHVHYQSAQDNIVDLSHRYRLLPNNKVLEQFTSAVSWSINNQWNLLGRWQTDLVADQTLEAAMGIEYNDCCWAIRLVTRRYLDNYDSDNELKGEFKNSIYFQFVLKGLSSLGNDNLGEMLQKQIPGYNRSLIEELDNHK